MGSESGDAQFAVTQLRSDPIKKVQILPAKTVMQPCSFADMQLRSRSGVQITLHLTRRFAWQNGAFL